MKYVILDYVGVLSLKDEMNSLANAGYTLHTFTVITEEDSMTTHYIAVMHLE